MQYVAAKSGATFPVYNPATEEFVAEVSEAEEADIDAAYAAAAIAQKKWAAMPAMTKAPLYGKLAGMIMQTGDELARLESIAMGKYGSLTHRPYQAANYRNWQNRRLTNDLQTLCIFQV